MKKKQTKKAEARNSGSKNKKGGGSGKLFVVSVVSLLIGVMVSLCVLSVTVIGKATASFSNTRYEVVPYSTSASNVTNASAKINTSQNAIINMINAADSEETDTNIVYSATDGDTNLYLLYLGHVNSAPISANTAIFYDGNTPINVSFSKSTVNEKSVEEAVAVCVNESTTHTRGFDIGVKVGFETGADAVFAKFKASLEVSLNAHYSKETSHGRSVTDTYTTATKKAQELTEAISFTIGEHNEPIGKYRLALFATVDMYMTVTLNADNSKVLDCDDFVAARENSYTYRVDYDTADGNFGKTASGKRIEFDDEYFTGLPIPTEFVEKIEKETIAPELKAGTHYEPMSATCLKHDKKYNPSEREYGDRNNGPSSNGVRAMIMGCAIENGKYTMVGGIGENTLELYLQIMEGTGKDQWYSSSPKDSNWSVSLSDDSEKNPYGFANADKKKVGYGAYQIKAFYTDGTNSVKEDYNFMQNKYKGQTIDVLGNGFINTDKTISRIEICVIYELKHSSSFWSDWRVDKTIYFNTI